MALEIQILLEKYKYPLKFFSNGQEDVFSAERWELRQKRG